MTGATSPMPPDGDADRSHRSSVPGGEPTVIVVPRPQEVSESAAEAIVAGLDAGIRERGRADFVTTGGSTPIGIYKVLSERLQGAIEWPRVHLWWGDDRFVPRDHPFSNVQPADAILLSIAQFAGQSGNQTEGIDVQEGLEAGLVIPVENIHPFPCTEAIAEARGTDWCAAQYERTMRAADLPSERGFPIFDVVLLGLGPDGHVMSVFPGSEAFDRSDWALPIPAPEHVEPHVARVTMNPAIPGVARTLLLVTSGPEKADVVGRIFREERDVRKLTGQLARRSGATWILDNAAAAAVPERLVTRR
jgi:6-phosphogluconolactonase